MNEASPMDQFKLLLDSDAIKFHALVDAISIDHGSQVATGNLMFTEGLTEHIGVELVGFGSVSVSDLKGTAQLIFANYPRGGLVPVSSVVAPYIRAAVEAGDLPPQDDAQYFQYIVDESQLDEDVEAVSENPVWVPDGGNSLLDNPTLQAELKKYLDGLEKARYSRIEEVRQQYREQIFDNGFTVLPVFDNETSINFAYSIGLSLKDLPELGASGRFPLDVLSGFVAHFAELSLNEGHALRQHPNAFELETEPGSFGMRIVEVDPHNVVAHHFVQAPIILERPVGRVCWIQISDAAGNWPGDPDFDNKFDQIDFGPVIAK
ncbi:hypothetical protein [Xanthomonas phage RTH11]|nr:hypothetical protein [Xanthomonas phage RTH11]